MNEFHPGNQIILTEVTDAFVGVRQMILGSSLISGRTNEEQDLQQAGDELHCFISCLAFGTLRSKSNLHDGKEREEPVWNTMKQRQCMFS